MKRTLLVTAALAAFLIPSLGASAGAKAQDAVCSPVTQAFSGTARDLIVPAHQECDVTNATITRDLIILEDSFAPVTNGTIGRDVVIGDTSGTELTQSTVGRDVTLGEDSEAAASQVTIGHDLDAPRPEASIHLELTTIGHDLKASQPITVQTSKNGPNTPGGPVYVGHDVSIDGAPDLPFVFDSFCDLHVGHDFSLTNRTVTLGTGLGGTCASRGTPGNEIGHDVLVTGNTALVGFFGPSSITVAGNQVGHNLVFRDNTAPPGGTLQVSGNTVGHDADCDGNSPAETAVTPNFVGHANTCG
jgi:hypothetical protein